MKKILGHWPFFLFLLPIFFVFHGFVENARFIRFMDCLPLMGKYCVAALVLYLLFYAFLKNSFKAGLVASFVMFFFLFFGYLHDFLRLHSIFLHRYSIILSHFLGVTVLLTLYLRKRAPLTRLSLFLTILMLSYIYVDGIIWAWKAFAKASPGPTVSQLMAGWNRKCDSCARPDIYLLLFDEYANSRMLQEVYHYNNNGLDSFLRSEDFHIQSNSRSNYAITPFSMASMLNASYLKGISNPLNIQADDYLNVLEPLRKSEVVNFLLSQGYSIINNSPFDLPEHPTLLVNPFIMTKTKLITQRTLIDYMVRDLSIFDWLDAHLTPARQYMENQINMIHRMNDTFLVRTLEESGRQLQTPRFVYMHVFMPHDPFLYDSLCRLRSPEEVDTIERHERGYLSYLPYTNFTIRQIITSIKKNTRGKAVILFMSDHGFRDDKYNTDHSNYFKNQNAVYFPHKDYSLFYDSISNVNQFRVVFNKLFHLNLPLLKDSTIFLHDIHTR